MLERTNGLGRVNGLGWVKVGVRRVGEKGFGVGWLRCIAGK